VKTAVGIGLTPLLPLGLTFSYLELVKPVDQAPARGRRRTEGEESDGDFAGAAEVSRVHRLSMASSLLLNATSR
jgi:hypothetical protein